MSLGKQAKVLNAKQVDALLHHVGKLRNGLRNQVIVLLSVRAGLRAKEIACLKWSMILGADGEIGDHIHLTNAASKGSSGRGIPINKQLKAALVDLHSNDRRSGYDWVMLTANGPSGASDYLVGHPGLRGRAAFLRAMPGEDHAAFLLLDNAMVRGDEIRERVRQGYLVRTRSDIETYEAKANDMTRANAAFASGAQIVSTDFEQAGNVYGTSYVVHLPSGGDLRCNPVNAVSC